MSKKTKQYSGEFKQDAVNYYYSSGKSMSAAASDLKVSQSSLHKWIKSAKSNEGLVIHRGSGNHSSDAEKEIARLKKELRDKEDALDILKKAIGILNENYLKLSILSLIRPEKNVVFQLTVCLNF